jgi:hypothetical protein
LALGVVVSPLTAQRRLSAVDGASRRVFTVDDDGLFYFIFWLGFSCGGSKKQQHSN